MVELVIGVRRISDWIMAITIAIESKILNLVSIYAPQMGLAKDIKEQFQEDLDIVNQDVLQSEKLFIGWDFNGHIGVEANGYDTTHGDFNYWERNNGGVSIVDFVVAYKLLVVNSYFKKKENHLVPYKSGSIKTQIE